MAKLENWRIEFQVMWGTVYGHDSLPDGMGIHTSGIKSIEVCDGYAEAVTRSGTWYYLGFDSIDMNQNALETTKAQLAAFGVSADFIGEAKILTRERKKAELMSVRQTAENGDLYLVATSEGVVRAYYKCKDRAYRLNIGIHVALILAGGTGIRLGSNVPKQYMEVQGRPVISYCMDIFTYHGGVHAIQIVADSSWHRFIMAQNEDEAFQSKFKGFSIPGANRQLSIYNALNDMEKYASAEDYVIVHDAARPCLKADALTEYMKAGIGHDGVMPVLPMKDTVYFSRDYHSISSLLEREHIFAGQAPELFRFGKYIDANRALFPDKIMQINGSTEPAVLAGMDVVMVPGDEGNFKITTKEDMERFVKILEGGR